MINFLKLISPFLFLTTIAETYTGQTLLTEIQKKYGSSTDFKAQFKQVIRYNGLDRKGVSSGNVFYKKPQKLKWMQEKPEPNYYYSNGKTMWLYMPNEAQVYVSKNLSEMLERISFMFLEDEKNLTKKFDISIIEPSPADKKKILKKNLDANITSDYVNYEFIPKEKENFLKAILTLEPKMKFIKKITIIDLAKNKTVIELSGMKFNQGLNDLEFEFKPPKDVTVYDTEK